MRLSKIMFPVAVIVLVGLVLPVVALACGKPPDAPLESCELEHPAGIAVQGVVTIVYDQPNFTVTSVSLLLTRQGVHTFTASNLPTGGAQNRIAIVCAIIGDLSPQILSELGLEGRVIKVTRKSVFGLPCPLNPQDSTCSTPDPNDLPNAGGFPLGVAVTSVTPSLEFTATGQIALYFVNP